MLETIQGEAGTIVPDDGYIKKCYDLTRKYNTLLVLDEVQCGLGRTGYLRAFEHDLAEHDVKPDIITFGKSLSGGMTPSSGIFADEDVMNTFTVGNHGSTFGGNPLSMAIIKAAMEVMRDENMVENSAVRGAQMRKGFNEINSHLLSDVRGRGLMTAIEVNRDSHVNGDDLCDIFRHHGILTKSTKEYSVRFTPALIINEQEVDDVVEMVTRSFQDLE
jgi:ornithine--oxo-acid transaminase